MKLSVGEIGEEVSGGQRCELWLASSMCPYTQFNTHTCQPSPPALRIVVWPIFVDRINFSVVESTKALRVPQNATARKEEVKKPFPQTLFMLSFFSKDPY